MWNKAITIVWTSNFVMITKVRKQVVRNADKLLFTVESVESRRQPDEIIEYSNNNIYLLILMQIT
jgi:hypothetical protein